MREKSLVEIADEVRHQLEMFELDRDIDLEKVFAEALADIKKSSASKTSRNAAIGDLFSFKDSATNNNAQETCGHHQV